MPRQTMEVTLNIVKSLRGRTALLVLAGSAALGTSLVLLLSHSAPAPADVNLNNLDCRGSVTKGEPSLDDPAATQVKYRFACNGPITGYSLQTNTEVQSIETETFGADAKTGAVFNDDSFSCNGDLPGYGINCVGKAGWLDYGKGTYDPSQKSYVVITGQYEIDGASICDEPRTDPILTVMTATKNATNVVSQAISGPFDLGRPSKSGCKASKFSGKTRIPKPQPSEDASNSEVG
jgi:hypothetical protein